MITLKTKAQIDQIKHNGKILREAVNLAAEAAKPGVTTKKLDEIIENHILKNDGIPTFKGYGRSPGRPGFPASACISVNDVLVHGIPGKLKLKDGDIVAIDIGVTKNKCIADSCYSFIVGQGSDKAKHLVESAKQITLYGIELIKPGLRVHDLATKIADKTEEFGLVTMPDLYGHGTGIQLHEKPTIPFTKPPYNEMIPNLRLEENMVITIEPVIAEKSSKGLYKEDTDHWTLRTLNQSLSAQFEHTVLVTADGYEILTGVFK